MQMMIENNQWADIQIRISHIYIKGEKNADLGWSLPYLYKVFEREDSKDLEN